MLAVVHRYLYSWCQPVYDLSSAVIVGRDLCIFCTSLHRRSGGTWHGGAAPAAQQSAEMSAYDRQAKVCRVQVFLLPSCNAVIVIVGNQPACWQLVGRTPYRWADRSAWPYACMPFLYNAAPFRRKCDHGDHAVSPILLRMPVARFCCRYIHIWTNISSHSLSAWLLEVISHSSAGMTAAVCRVGNVGGQAVHGTRPGGAQRWWIMCMCIACMLALCPPARTAGERRKHLAMNWFWCRPASAHARRGWPDGLCWGGPRARWSVDGEARCYRPAAVLDGRRWAI